jgi:hypothetical protein
VELDPNWKFVADDVMGGKSNGGMSLEMFQGRNAAVLRGDVSLDSNGGFIQIALDLLADGAGFDASNWDGIELDVWGNGERYDIRLRTDQLTRPWQSFQKEFATTQEWQVLQVPFDSVMPHRTDAIFDSAKLRRVGILAIGREFQAELAVAKVKLYRA